MKPITASLVFCFLILPLALQALENDRAQPIEIEADHLTLDEQAQVSTYRGKVKLTQGSLRIQADELVLTLNDDKKIDSILMTGAPALYRQQAEDGEVVEGQARQMDYRSTANELVLRGDAELNQGGDIIKSELIRINTQTNALQAGEPGNGDNDRVHMVIQPVQDDKDTSQ